MKIVHIVPGSGGTFYCQNCIRDLGLVKALRRAGQDVIIAPMYLPLELNDPEIETGSPLFYGAVKVYLKQVSPMMRKAPGWFDRLLDSQGMLKMAAKQAGSTDAPGLAELTLSTLAGEQGNQSDELEKMALWLKNDIKPEVINLSNALLLGLGSRLKEVTGARIYCTLQDEDVWVNAMDEANAKRIWQIMTERAREIDGFSAVSRYYAGLMKEKLSIPDHKIHVIYPVIDFKDYIPADNPPEPPVIGFLSRTSESLGLGVLVDAYIRIRKNDRIKGLRLHINGGCTKNDKSFISSLKKKLSREGLTNDVIFFDDFEKPDRISFLQGLTLLSVPVSEGEGFATYMIEGMACGIPSVQPRAGAFTEIIEETGGGVTYAAGNADELVSTLESLLADKELVAKLGKEGRKNVTQKFSEEAMAEKTIKFYSGT